MKTLSIVLLLFFACFSNAAAFETPDYPPQPQVTFEEVSNLVLQLDVALDALPPEAFPTITSLLDVKEWEEEAVPFFAYEGIVFPTKEDMDHPFYIFPDISIVPFNGNETDFNHLLGTTDCFGGDIQLNERLFRRISGWYNRPDLLVILVHELAHANGVCFGDKGTFNPEVSAQLVALEILSAMTNKGNPYTLGPMLTELRYMGLAAARYLAITQGYEDDYQTLLHTVADKQEIAEWDKSVRHWADDPEGLLYIIENYNYVPIREIIIALKNQSCLYTDVGLDDDVNLVYTVTTMEQSCISGVFLPSNWGVFHKPLVIDDLAYILENDL